MDHDEIPSELQGPLFPAEHDNHLMAIDETPLVAHRENTPPASPTALAHNEIPAELQEPLDGFMAHRLYENDLLAIDQTLLMDPTTFKALPGVASGDASGASFESDAATTSSAFDPAAILVVSTAAGSSRAVSTSQGAVSDGLRDPKEIADQQLKKWSASDRPVYKLFRNFELVNMILVTKQLTDLMLLSKTSTAIRYFVKYLFRSRTEAMIKTFFVVGVLYSNVQAKFFETFWDLIDNTVSAIHGSVVGYTIWRPDPAVPEQVLPGPNNFNLSIPFGTGSVWHQYMTSLGAGPPVELEVYPSAANEIHRRFKYTLNKGRDIIFMETTGPSVFGGIISTAETTSQARAITRDFLWVWYGRLADLRQALDTFDGPTIAVCHAMEARHDKRSVDTSSWPTVCGPHCGILQRHAGREDGVAQFCVGVDGREMDPAYRKTRVVWRLGDSCVNSACTAHGASTRPFATQ